MTIDEAIEILKLMGLPEFEGHTEDILAARRLGIEALKWRKFYRETHPEMKWPLLPGETEE
ncbi:hypothetical protein ES703_105446 [subsurface metagenome]